MDVYYSCFSVIVFHLNRKHKKTEYFVNIYATLVINSIIFIVLGLFIAIKPVLAYEFTVNIVSAYFLIMGFIAIVTGFNEKKYNRGYVGSFALGALYIVAAILIYTLADQIIKIVPYLLGIIILVVGVSHLVNAL
ncbi:DUF308 domain-containing protein, partial [Streptococcus mutans]|nr:DUF308 domain-containing protein [Streptococcus mutans]